jgi:signal transduction histidine kinase
LADIGIQDLEPVNLSKVVEEVTGLFQIGDDHIQWEVEGFGDHVVVRGSMPHLLRVFNNLISNAVHAMVDQPNKVIRIVCESRNEGWQITVQDNGSGIEESQLEQVFQPHFTLKKGGAGLGLTITRSVVNQLGGSIYVSRIQGVWTEFILWFPVV